MTPASSALRATSDTLMRDLEALGALEEEKRATAPSDPRLVDLAQRVETIAARVLTGSARQRVLSEAVSAAAAAAPGANPVASIEATPRAVSAILADWRDLERRASTVEPGSAEATEIALLTDRLREEYSAAFESSRGTR